MPEYPTFSAKHSDLNAIPVPPGSLASLGTYLGAGSLPTSRLLAVPRSLGDAFGRGQLPGHVRHFSVGCGGYFDGGFVGWCSGRYTPRSDIRLAAGVWPGKCLERCRLRNQCWVGLNTLPNWYWLPQSLGIERETKRPRCSPMQTYCL